MKAGRSRTLFVNADGAGSRLLRAGNVVSRVVSIGLINEADYMAFNVGGTRQAWEFFVELRGRSEIFLINFTGDRQVYNALFAIAAADQLGFTPEQIRRGLQRFRRPSSCRFSAEPAEPPVQGDASGGRYFTPNNLGTGPKLF